MDTTESAIDEHQNRLLSAFGAVLAAEEKLSDVKGRQQEAETLLQQERNGAETNLERAWAEVERILADTGEVEVVLL